MPSVAIRTAKSLVIALTFVAACFVVTVCVYKLAFQGSVRRYTDGMELQRSKGWRAVKSEWPMLRLSAVTAAWLVVAAGSGLWLWRLRRPTRGTVLRVMVSEILVLFALVALLACLKPSQQERIRVFLDPAQDPLGSGFAAFHVRERFIPRWPVTAAFALIVVSAALPGLHQKHWRSNE